MILTLAFAAAAADYQPQVLFDEATMTAFAARQSIERPDWLAATESVRRGLAVDASELLTRPFIAEGGALSTALGPIDPASMPLLSRFATNAIARAAGPEATGLYNPIADVWLLMRWRMQNGRPILTSAVWADGGALRGDDVRWWDASGSFGDALVGGWQRSAAAFDQRFRAAGTMPPLAPLDARATVARRLAQLEQGVLGVEADSRLASRLERARRTHLANPRSSAGDPVALQVDALPATIRASTRLAAVFRRPNGLSAAYASPLRPDLVFFLNLDGDEGNSGMTVVAFPEPTP
jgi:hypothetical protein